MKTAWFATPRTPIIERDSVISVVAKLPNPSGPYKIDQISVRLEMGRLENVAVSLPDSQCFSALLEEVRPS